MIIYEIVGAIVVVILATFGYYHFAPKRMKQTHFVEKWQKLQVYCRDKTTWPLALEEADQLLKRALKKQHYKGKNIGEKMVAAQRIFTDNDSLWYAHKLYKKIKNEEEVILKESDIKDALVGFRQALRDLGALPSDESRRSE